METTAFQLVKNGNAEEAFQKNTIQLAEPEKDEVTIDVESFGLNYADVMARRGLYRECPALPTVIGYEVVGNVSAVGTPENNFLIGKRVVAFTRFGGYSKKVNTKFEAAVEIDNMNGGKALCLATQYVTAYYMSHYVTQVHNNENVLIHAAAGGVGTALIQLLKSKNANIIAKTGSDDKIAYLKSLGVDKIINYNKVDYVEEVKKLLDGARLAVSFNPVAGSSFKKDFKLIGAGGRLIIFGGSERSGKKWGILSTLNFLRKMGLIIPIGLMMRSKSIIGVNMLKIGDFRPEVMKLCLKEVVQLAKDNKIDPKVGATYTADNLAEAHNFLESGKSVGKVVVEW